MPHRAANRAEADDHHCPDRRFGHGAYGHRLNGEIIHQYRARIIPTVNLQIHRCANSNEVVDEELPIRI